MKFGPVFTLGNILIYIAIILAFTVSQYVNWQLGVVAFASPYIVAFIVFAVEDEMERKRNEAILRARDSGLRSDSSGGTM